MSNRVKQMAAAVARPGNPYALEFGVGDTCTVTHNSIFNFGTGEYTLTCWIKAAAGSQTENFVYPLNKSNSFSLYFRVSDGAIRTRRGGSEASFISPTIPTNCLDDQWHHCGITFKTSGDAEFYIDGELDGVEDAGLADVSEINDLVMNGVGNGLVGVVSRMRLFARGVSANEMYLESRGMSASGVGLAAHWPLNEGSGTTARDISGNGHNGTINGATYTTDKPF